MKKFRVAPLSSKKFKAVLAAALALTMAVPTTNYLSAKSADVAKAAESSDAAVKTYSFDKGFSGEGLEAVEMGETIVYEHEKDANGIELKDDEGNTLGVFKTETKTVTAVDADGNVVDTDQTSEEMVPYKNTNGEYTVTSSGNQPSIAADAERGTVFTTRKTKEALSYPSWATVVSGDKKSMVTTDALLIADSIGQTQIYGKYNSAAVASENPFAAYRDQLVEENPEYVTYENPEDATSNTYTKPVWNKGVTISYWAKMPIQQEEIMTVDENGKEVGTGEYKDVVNDSVLIQFENEKRTIYKSDDLAKNAAANGYDAAKALDPSDPYYMGEVKDMKIVAYWGNNEKDSNWTDLKKRLYDNDGNKIDTSKANNFFSETAWDGKCAWLDENVVGKTLKVRVNAGTMYSWNPNAVSGNIVLKEIAESEVEAWRTSTTNAAGQKPARSVVCKDESTGKYYVVSGGGTFTSYIDPYKTTSEDAYGLKTMWTNNTRGYMMLTAQGLYYTEDNQSGIQQNPNANNYLSTALKDLQNYAGNNSLSALDTTNEVGTLLTPVDADAWHYVSMVIRNDGVSMYVDGEKVEDDSMQTIAGTCFNYGSGAFYEDGSIASVGRTDLQKTHNETFAGNNWVYGYTFCTDLMDWLTDADTKLYFGGKGGGYGKDMNTFAMETQEGAMIDDVKFYITPFTEDEAAAAYEAAVAADDAKKNAAVNKIAEYNFNDGTLNGGSTEVASNNTEKVDAPSVVSDDTRKNVLKVAGGTTSATSAAVFANPFAGKDLTGASISYWVKVPANAKTGAVTDTVAVSFFDDPKDVTHSKIHENYLEAAKSQSSILYTTAATTAKFIEGTTFAGGSGSLKNMYTADIRKSEGDTTGAEVTKYNEVLNSLTEWQFVTAVFDNTGIKMYLNGEALDNNYTNFAGERFLDGYYNAQKDPFYEATDNQGATPMMDFLTYDDTKVYVGFANQDQKSSKYEKTQESYFDSIAFYDKALTADDVKAVYEAAKTEPLENTSEEGNGGQGGETSDTGVTDKTEETKKEVQEDGTVVTTKDATVTYTDGTTANIVTVITEKPDGTKTTTVAYTGKAADGTVEVEAALAYDGDAVPEDANWVVSKIGTDKDAYKAAVEKIKTVSGVSADKVTVYDISLLDANNVSIQPNGDIKVTLPIPEGYATDAAKLRVVRIEDGQVFEVTVTDGKLTFTTNHFSQYAIVEVNTDDGSAVLGSATATKTGDVANVAVPVVIIAAAVATMLAASKKKAFQK